MMTDNRQPQQHPSIYFPAASPVIRLKAVARFPGTRPLLNILANPEHFDRHNTTTSQYFQLFHRLTLQAMGQ